MIIEQFVTSSDAGSYLELPFEMPENTERIDITYKYNAEAGNAIDFALYRGIEHIGASGSSRRHLWVSEYDSSPGFKQMPLTSGTYKIILGAYQVAEEGAQVVYEINFTPKSLQLLKGDMHTHTTASDGHHSQSQLLEIAKTIGLDFICITDHNNLPVYVPSDEKLTAIPGVEWTDFAKGHSNFIGVYDSLKLPYYAKTLKEAQEIMKQAQEAGALVGLNHFKHETLGWEWGYDVPYDMLEVWNGHPKPSNNAAIKFWHDELCLGKRLVAVGGSDFHNLSVFGTLAVPTTWVYAQSRGASDIIKAIREGHVFISLTSNGPIIAIECGECIMGDVVPYEDQKPILFTFEKIEKGDKITIYHESGEAVNMISDKKGRVCIEVPMERRLFYRAEVVRELAPNILPFAMPVLVSNPVYIDTVSD